MDADHDPSIEHEPQWARRRHEIDPSEARAENTLADESRDSNPDEAVDHSVWDEPALSREFVAEDDGSRLTYADWLAWRLETTPASHTWLITLLTMLAAGPFAVLGALLHGFAAGTWGLVAVAIIAPVTEEVMKIAIALWIVEKRPYLFRWSAQILLSALAGGLAFAAIENVMYLEVYIPDPTAKLAAIRWTVCVTMHVTCALLAGFGLVRMWRRSIAECVRPDIRIAAPWIVGAICIHGLYNASVTIAQIAGWLQF